VQTALDLSHAIAVFTLLCRLCRQEQLRQYEAEKQLLLGQSENAEQEIEALSRQYATLLGHQNQKQKIHHILKIKEENIGLKKVCVCAIHH